MSLKIYLHKSFMFCRVYFHLTPLESVSFSLTSEPVNVFIWLMCAYFRFISFFLFEQGTRKNLKQQFSSFQLIASNYKARLDSGNLEWSQQIQSCLSSDECSTIAKKLSPNGFIITESLLSRKSNQEISLRNPRNQQRRNRKTRGFTIFKWLRLYECVNWH